MINYLQRLKEKCNLSDEFINIINDFLEKLYNFSYITSSGIKKLQKKLYENIDYVSIGNINTLDYKSGYYDASKKELYIKDLSNIEAIYLRLIYIITTTQIEEHTYEVGYSKCEMSHENYRIVHKNFGINRAICSNLVCRLLYTVPTTLSIVPTYRTYENDFLGNKLNSDNDIYYLEGTLLRQICYILNINEEQLYFYLFSNKPAKYLNKLYFKYGEATILSLFENLDNLSRKYSNYNKLCYLNNLLDKNYIEIKKNILNNDISDLKKNEEKIKNQITIALSKLNDNDQNYKNNEDQFNILNNFSEKISNIESDIVSIVYNIQDTLTDYIMSKENSYFIIDYLIKLKKFNDMLITKNKKLEECIYKNIYTKLIHSTENVASNLIDKIKYSLINEILSTDKYIKLYNDLEFKIIDIENSNSHKLIILTAYNTFIQLIDINYLDNSMRLLENNSKSLKLDNLKYLHDNPSLPTNIEKIEKIFSCLKSNNNDYKNLQIENLYTFSLNNKNFLLVIRNDKFEILNILEFNNSFNFEKLALSQNYKIFNMYDASKLPVLYKKENLVTKILSIFKTSFSS